MDQELADLLKEEARIEALIREEMDGNVYSPHFFKGKSYDQILDRLTKDADPDAVDPSEGLSSPEDQIRILKDMKEDEIPLRDIPSLGSLFKHVDNVRYTYEKNHAPLPDWYREKYQSLLVK